jgi:phage terminase large subunit GpA-like protein
MTTTDIEFLKHLNKQKTIRQPSPDIAAFISKNRILPPGTPFPGPVDLRLTPHVIEWLWNMSIYSGVQHQAILKAAQIAATFAIECIIGYWMREMPTAIMYLSATQDLLEKWGTKRLEPMIDSIGMREKILEHAENQFGRKSRRTGDKTFSKQFIGGFLEMASAQSPASQRSDSIRVMIRDEIDGAPTLLTTGEGNWLNTSAARTKFWGDRKKITDLSTPTTHEMSNIYPLYEDGDRRLRMVPCPLCSTPQKPRLQPLYWLPEVGNHGLRGDFKAGKLVDAYYLCEFCHDAIFDIHKYDMFNAGVWEPTAVSKSTTLRSYYINSLYSPPRTVSWKDYYTEWYNSKDNPDMLRGFTNLYGGMPYRETGTRPKLDTVIELRGGYDAGTVTDNILWITAGGDVQRGKKMYEHYTDEDIDQEIERLREQGKDPWHHGLPRIEVEVLGHSHGYRTASVEYLIFYGSTADPYAGAWEKLRQWINETNLIYTREDGSRIPASKMLIDSGDGERTNAVYDFCEPYDIILPCKGDQVLKKNKNIKGDEITKAMFSRYQKTKIGESQILVTMSTNYYKSRIYNNLKIPRTNNEEQRPGFMDHPRQYGDWYFKMLTAEEKRIDGSFHDSGRRNEALDVKVYALTASDVLIDEWVYSVRDSYVKAGMPREKARLAYDHAMLIRDLLYQRSVEHKKIMEKAK